MNYRFEMNGRVFGSMVFQTKAEASSYLEHLLELAVDRYKMAAKTNKSDANSLREVRLRILRDLKIVAVSGGQFAGQVVTLEKISGAKKPGKLSRRWQRYNEIGEG